MELPICSLANAACHAFRPDLLLNAMLAGAVTAVSAGSVVLRMLWREADKAASF
jgi:hypothetical protein